MSPPKYVDLFGADRRARSFPARRLFPCSVTRWRRRPGSSSAPSRCSPPAGPAPSWRRATASGRWGSSRRAPWAASGCWASAVLGVGLAERRAGLAAAVLGGVRVHDLPRRPGAPPISLSPRGREPDEDADQGPDRGRLLHLALAGLLLLIFGNAGKNESFQPQNEFKLKPWVSIRLAGINRTRSSIRRCFAWSWPAP